MRGMRNLLHATVPLLRLEMPDPGCSLEVVRRLFRGAEM
jgi:hypothetical protein